MADFVIENGVLKRYIGKSKKVVVPKAVIEIGEGAFAGQTIETVIIPDGVTVVGSYAFYECVHLTEVFIPKSAKLIEQCAFGFCRALNNITIPTSIERIEQDAFIGCDSLTEPVLTTAYNNEQGMRKNYDF